MLLCYYMSCFKHSMKGRTGRKKEKKGMVGMGREEKLECLVDHKKGGAGQWALQAATAWFFKAYNKESRST